MITTVGAKVAGRRGEDAAPMLGPGELLKGPFTGRALRQQGYLLASFAGAFVQVLWMIVALPVGGTLVLVVIGLPLLLAGLTGLRRAARRERLRILNLTGERVPTPYREPAPSGSVPQRLLGNISDPATWRDLVHLLVSATLGAGWFAVVVSVWAMTLGAVTLPFWYTALPEHRIPLMHANGSEYYISTLPAILAFAAISLVFAWFFGPTVLELATRAQTGLGRALLGLSRPELDRRENALRTTRSQAVSAAEAERRRIERDLHDGAQQRLVALAMDLGRAKSKLKSGDEADSAAAAQLVAEAHEGVKLALTELRDLARGIHPAVLTDRGLDAALSALAGRSPIPVEVDAALPWRPSPGGGVGGLLRGLRGAGEHGQARARHPRLDRAGDPRRAAPDDRRRQRRRRRRGRTPAAAWPGLSDRIAPLDGILSVSSPIGGPTQIIMEMPCPKPSAS